MRKLRSCRARLEPLARSRAPLAVFAFALGVALSTDAAGAITDDGTDLARAARAAIEADRSIADRAGLKLKLSAAAGTVRLAGSAGTIYDRIRAVQVAEGVDGVRSVRPSIRIEPTVKVDAAALDAAVRAAIRAAGVGRPQFSVQVESGGVVHLNGEVTDEWLALEAVRRVPGVTAIGGYDARLPGRLPPDPKGELRVLGPTPAQDETVAVNVRSALRDGGIAVAEELFESGVTVKVTQGIVELTGAVADAATWARADDTARRLPGVRGVRNGLKVYSQLWRVGPVAPDDELSAAVRSTLSRGRSLRLEDMEVRVAAGRVYLTGRAADADTAMAAVDAAARTPGVREVVSALTYPRTSAGHGGGSDAK